MWSHLENFIEFSDVPWGLKKNRAHVAMIKSARIKMTPSKIEFYMK